MKLTLDSTEPLQDAMRVVGALYGVTLVLAQEDRHAQPLEPVDPAEPVKPRRARRRHPAAIGKRSRLGQSASGANIEGIAPLSRGLPSNAEVRSWARANGFTVSDRGRVPASVQTAYHDAHGESPGS